MIWIALSVVAIFLLLLLLVAIEGSFSKERMTRRAASRLFFVTTSMVFVLWGIIILVWLLSEGS